MRLTSTIKFVAICAVWVVLCTGCKAKKDEQLFFAEQPVYGNSRNTPDNRMVGNESMDSLQRLVNEIADGKQLKFDSAASFVTNFAYQKHLTLLQDDRIRLDSLYGPAAFRVIQQSFLLPYKYEEVRAELKKIDTRISRLGNCSVYQIDITLKGAKSDVGLTSVYLIFKREPNVSRLPVTCIAFSVDSIAWLPVHENKEVVPVLNENMYDGRGHKTGILKVPLLYERNHNRFSPAGHFVMHGNSDSP